MSDLDKKLERIVEELAGEDVYPHWSSDYIDKIKQAFIDAGWFHSPLVDCQMKRIESGELMTGQEWYDRYRTEWNKIVATGNVTAGSHIDAAKKAAGIE